MSDWAFYVNNLTLTAVADGANFTDSGYAALQGAGSAVLTKVKRWSISGLAAVTSAMQMAIAYDSTVGATLTALSSPNSNGPVNAKSQALSASPAGFIASTTKPQRSNSI